MCNVCSALTAMRETLHYEDFNGRKWVILAVGESPESEGKFQIQKSGYVFRDQWIETSDLATSMAELGADIDPEERRKPQWKYFGDCIRFFGYEA